MHARERVRVRANARTCVCVGVRVSVCARVCVRASFFVRTENAHSLEEGRCVLRLIKNIIKLRLMPPLPQKRSRAATAVSYRVCGLGVSVLFHLIFAPVEPQHLVHPRVFEVCEKFGP